MVVRPEIAEYIAKYGKKPQEMSVPEKATAYGLRGVQAVAGALPFGISAATTTPGLEYAIQRIEKKTPEQAFEEAKIAGITDAAVSAATAGLPFVGAIGKLGARTALKTGTKAIGREIIESGLKPGIKTISKEIAEAGTKGETKEIAKIVGKGMGLQDSTIRNLDNPYILENFKKVGAQEAEGLADTAAQGIKKLSKDFHNISSEFYRKRGIKDTDPVNIKEAIKSIDNLINQKQQTGAITKEIGSALADARYTLKQIKKTADKKGNIPFALLKEHTKNLWDAAEGAYDVGNKSASKIYGTIRKELSSARDSIPAIREASADFNKLSKTEDTLENILKMGKDPEEINLERKILRRTKDKSNQEFKRELDVVDDWLKTTPEAAGHIHSVDDVKLAHIANDLEGAKAIQPSSEKRWLPFAALQKIPGVATEDKLKLLKNMVQSGVIKPGTLSSSVKYSDLPMIGNLITKGRARRALYGEIPKEITGIGKATLQELRRKVYNNEE